MSRRNLRIFECQQGRFSIPTEEMDEPYTYDGFDKSSGLHRFIQAGKVELFAKRKDAYAGWHLLRGHYHYEFCRSA